METRQRRQIRLHETLAGAYEERYAPEFANVFQTYRINDLLREVSHLPPDARVLDLGCGTGVMMPALTQRFRSVLGLDLSFEMLQKASVKYPGEMAVGDGMKLPLASSCLDAVVCRGALHHTPAPAGAVEEVRRVLKPGGMLVLSEPCNDSPLVRVARWGLYRASGKFDKADVAFRSKGLARLLIEGGYEGIRLRRFGFLAYLLAAFPDVLGALRYLPASRLLTKVLIRMDRILAWIPLLRVNGFHIILSANKPGGPE